ncbi:MAG: glycine--tRNA ligase subunit beta [Candidatus Omnitrophica bacterium CG1_02_40_15]|nr:MAG: glycine--tRNA ligase subunit beta [Candidatus Omnitrophica bacterium CG1_02_40_15]
MKRNVSDFLLEINVEELPASYVRPALAQLKEAFIEKLSRERIEHGEVRVFGTAATLLCYVKDMQLRQKELSQEIIGPPKKIAFDENGNPTPQGIGFAKNQGVDIKDLKIKQMPKGEYVFIVKKIKSKPAKEVLRGLMPEIVKSIGFPKTMKWDDSGVRFARPIESIAVLLDKENVKIKLGNVPAKFIKGASAGAYLKKLENAYMLDQDKRKIEIEHMIKAVQKKLGLDEYADKNLLEETNFLVKSPVLIIGDFDKKYLAIPKDVLAASMSKHQRVFTLSKNNKLINKFIAVIDGKGRSMAKMKKQYANILEARLKDSLFFYNEDIKKPLSDQTPKLKDLIFQKDLGNMFEKIQRLEELSSFISERIGIDTANKEDIKRAAYLCKSDLVTQMVGEFPSLQGVMGMEYALKSGEKKSVAIAIKEHYLPKGMDDSLPETIEGAILAISDRVDNIVGFLGSGIEPKGSFDPFGIRRNSQGLIQILNHKSIRLELSGLIKKAIEVYKGKLKISQEELEKKVLNYIKERLEFLAPDTRPIELKQAVLKSGCNDIVSVFKRVEALSEISAEKYFLKAAKVCERTSNILKGAVGAINDRPLQINDVKEELFKEDLEKEVWMAYTANNVAIKNLIKEERYKEATKAYGEAFFEALHRFFDNVLVNTEDSALRGNRLAMMQAINKLYTNDVADLALLPQIIIR